MMDSGLPGFRFYPTEEELVCFYLHHKLRGTATVDMDRVIPVVDIYNYNPWELPRKCVYLDYLCNYNIRVDPWIAEVGGEVCGGAESEQWFFFSRRREREARGGRPNRLTREGYWKATGSPGDVYSSQNSSVIGRKRSMVFYVGRAPNGTKTSWKMNEYKLAIHNSHFMPSSSSSPPPNPQVYTYISSFINEYFVYCELMEFIPAVNPRTELMPDIQKIKKHKGIRPAAGFGGGATPAIWCCIYTNWDKWSRC